MQVEFKAIQANFIALNIDFSIIIAYSRHKIAGAFSVGFSSRKKVRFETRERLGKRESKEDRGTRKSRRFKKRRTNRCKGPGLSHGYPDTRKKKIMAMRRPKRTDREKDS